MQYVYSAVFVFFFFFSSRRRHTRFDCDWSSDVCSSDLQLVGAVGAMHYFSLLTDARGTVLEVQGPLERSDIRVQAIARVGVDLSEQGVGTTAIGAALAEHGPVWLHRAEHFFEANRQIGRAHV